MGRSILRLLVSLFSLGISNSGNVVQFWQSHQLTFFILQFSNLQITVRLDLAIFFLPLKPTSSNLISHQLCFPPPLVSPRDLPIVHGGDLAPLLNGLVSFPEFPQFLLQPILTELLQPLLKYWCKVAVQCTLYSPGPGLLRVSFGPEGLSFLPWLLILLSLLLSISLPRSFSCCSVLNSKCPQYSSREALSSG